jgi:hypothetical protein
VGYPISRVTDKSPVLVPISVRAARWTTVPPRRTVLLVTHNVTSLNRLLDIVPTFENDACVQLVANDIEADLFLHGLEVFERAEITTLPWTQEKLTNFARSRPS